MRRKTSYVYMDALSGITVLSVTSKKHGTFLTAIDEKHAKRIDAESWQVFINKQGKIYFRAKVKDADGVPRTIPLHRFVLDATGKIQVDHVRSDDTLDNRESNLRLATSQQNNWNKLRMRTNTSGFIGVRKVGNRYKAESTDKRGRGKSIGYRDTAEEAARLYDSYVRKIRGQFVVLNFPLPEQEAA